MTTMPIFISYRHKEKDSELALKLVDFIHTKWKFCTCWMDHRIEGGERWLNAIDGALDQSVAVLVLLSKEAVDSTYITYEWAYAKGQGKKVIPVYLELRNGWENSLHEYIRGDFQHYVIENLKDLSYEELEKHKEIKRLRETLEGLFDKQFIPQELINAQIAVSGHNELERQQALKFLEEHPAKEQTELLLKQIISSNTTNTIKRDVARVIARKFHDEEVIDLLSDFENISEDDIRENLKAIAMIDTPLAVDELSKIRLGEYQDIVDEVWQFMTCSEAEHIVLEIMGNDLMLPEHLYTALARYATPASTKRLADTFRMLTSQNSAFLTPITDEDLELLPHIIWCLGQAKHREFHVEISNLLVAKLRKQEYPTRLIKACLDYIQNTGSIQNIQTLQYSLQGTLLDNKQLAQEINRIHRIIRTRTM